MTVKMDTRIFIISRKVKVSVAACVILSGLLLLVCGCIGICKSMPTTSPVGNKIILLDPGHGGIDAGASEDDAIEKTLNLEIAMVLKSYIEENGGICYMTRAEDTNTADPNRKKGTSQKMSDLEMRKRNIDDYKADIFVSIHMNKFSQSQYSGLQVFYDGSSAESKALGEAIQSAAKRVVDTQNKRSAKATGDKIYVLKGNPVPSVLVECGFLSNEAERNKLKTPEYQRKVAWGIYLGIMDYLSR